MPKANRLKQWRLEEFRRLAGIADPMTALDRCRDAIKRAGKDYWTKRQTYLGVLAATYERIRQSKDAWRKFIENPFWRDPDLYGSRPTMKDRSEGLGFVIRYSKRAMKKEKYQLAWRHAVVAEYLLTHGVKPVAFAAYLGERGQGINATYAKAQAEKKLAEGGETPKFAKPKGSAKVVTRDQKGSSGGTRKRADAEAQNANFATTTEKTLIGKRELMEPLLLLALDTKMDIRVKAVRDVRGRCCLKVVKLLSAPATGQTTSERRKINARRPKPKPPGIQHSNRKHRRNDR